MIKPDGTHYKLTHDDVQQFLFAAGFKSQRKFNLNGATDMDTAMSHLNFTDPSQAIYGSDPRNAVLSTGALGQHQRIFAVQKAIYDHEQRLHGAHSFLPPNTLRQPDQLYGGAGFTENAEIIGQTNPYLKPHQDILEDSLTASTS